MAEVMSNGGKIILGARSDDVTITGGNTYLILYNG